MASGADPPILRASPSAPSHDAPTDHETPPHSRTPGFEPIRRRFDSESEGERLPYDHSLLNGGERSLSSIGLQAFCLGLVFAGSIAAAIGFLVIGLPYWRLPAFLAALSLFHFLEYFTTARWNTPAVRASSFLLFNNGQAYNIAHGSATVEIIIGFVSPSYQLWLVSRWVISFGVLLVIVGQTVRSIAMAQAGTNFSHLLAKSKLAGHRLVTDGIYSVLRHPSYFGFYWWAVGTQLMVGNKVCLMAYAVVLWKFFNARIIGEEESLVLFFGREYEDFRAQTATGIPFIK